MKPILVFPKPNIAQRKKKRQPIPQPRIPGRARQGLRLNSSFYLLANNFKNGLLSGDPAGFAPERTLVLETIGSVEAFYKAAAKIEGLDFIQEIFSEELESDDDFYYENKEGRKEDKNLKGFAYLTMANQDALDKLLKYWKDYTTQKNYKFPRGLAPLKNLFEHLYSIRYWDTNDRLRQTGLIDDWKFRLEEGQQNVPVEVEFWYRNSFDVQSSNETRVSRLISELGGEVLQSCVINEIQYHALLASIPSGSINELINGNLSDIELMRCDDVMYFRPSGQCMAPLFTDDGDNKEEKEGVSSIDTDLNEINDVPTVALLDGLPLENHEWLKDYLIVDDPDDWSDDYTPSDQKHGTSMASLIIRGDMEGDENPLPRKIYCRPILKPLLSGFDGQTREVIPAGILPIDIIHRSVRHMFESDGDQAAVASSVKIINLSIADPTRLFDQLMSPWAKLIDYLSEKYQVLFVISAGNHLDDIDLGMTNREFNELNADEKEALVLKGVSDNTHTRRLMSPAESINAITVAAYHHDEHEADEFHGRVNPYNNRTLPSTINPVTWGRRRSVKPEILMPGGRATYRLKGFLDSDPAVLEILTFNRPPGQKVASPGELGSINSFSYTFGTSNSAALASRRLCFLNETIQDLYLSEYGEEISREYENVLLKSLLCHGASHSKSFSRIEEILKEPHNSRRFNSVIAKYLGFGNVNQERIHGCLDNQATILQCDTIKQDDMHTYVFTLPESLNAKTDRRRLIITLSWLSPVNTKNCLYRQAKLFIAPATGDREDNYLELQKRELDWQMVRNGTVQHEVLSGDLASPFIIGTKLEIAIECRGQAGAKNISVPYGLVITLDMPDSDLPIYEEVKSGIEAQFKARTEAEQRIK